MMDGEKSFEKEILEVMNKDPEQEWEFSTLADSLGIDIADNGARVVIWSLIDQGFVTRVGNNAYCLTEKGKATAD